MFIMEVNYYIQFELIQIQIILKKNNKKLEQILILNQVHNEFEFKGKHLQGLFFQPMYENTDNIEVL